MSLSTSMASKQASTTQPTPPSSSASPTGGAIKTTTIAYSSAAGGSFQVSTAQDRHAFCRTVQQAIGASQRRGYGAVYAATHRYIQDNTGAEEDCKTFISAMKTCFNITAKEVVWDAKHAGLFKGVGKDLGDYIESFDAEAGRKLFFWHYAGHGERNGGNLSLVPHVLSGEEISFTAIENMLVDTTSFYREDLADVDIIIVLDCCHAGAAVRLPPGGRTCEVFAACSEQNSANARDTRKGQTFTTMFCSELMSMKRRVRDGGEKGVVFTVDLFDSICKARNIERPDPIRTMVKGMYPIQLPLEEAPESTPTQPTFAGPRVLVSFHLENTTDGEEMREVCEWVEKLPRALKLTWEGVIPSTSSLLLLVMPLRFFWHLEWNKGFTFVGPAQLCDGDEQAPLVTPEPATRGPRLSPEHPGSRG